MSVEAEAHRQAIIGNYTLTANTNQYFFRGPTGGLIRDEEIVWPHTAKLQYLIVRLATTLLAGQRITITLYVNGVPTNLTVQLAEGDLQKENNNVMIPLHRGDMVTWNIRTEAFPSITVKVSVEACYSA